jgi:hypothetical protein
MAMNIIKMFNKFRTRFARQMPCLTTSKMLPPPLKQTDRQTDKPIALPLARVG